MFPCFLLSVEIIHRTKGVFVDGSDATNAMIEFFKQRFQVVTELDMKCSFNKGLTTKIDDEAVAVAVFERRKGAGRIRGGRRLVSPCPTLFVAPAVKIKYHLA